MSAEVLREAAALMRERAEAARSGRWFAEGDEVRADWTLVRQVATCHGSIPEGNENNATHIASWHPAVALAVADWLEAEATSLDAMANFTTAVAEMEYETTVRGAALTVHKTEAGEITFRADTSAPALAVARAYLGSDR